MELHSIMSKFLTIHVYVYAIQGKKINFLFQRKINWNYSLLFLLMIGNYHTIWCYCYICSETHIKNYRWYKILLSRHKTFKTKVKHMICMGELFFLWRDLLNRLIIEEYFTIYICSWLALIIQFDFFFFFFW